MRDLDTISEASAHSSVAWSARFRERSSNKKLWFLGAGVALLTLVGGLTGHAQQSLSFLSGACAALASWWVFVQTLRLSWTRGAPWLAALLSMGKLGLLLGLSVALVVVCRARLEGLVAGIGFVTVTALGVIGFRGVNLRPRPRT